MLPLVSSSEIASVPDNNNINRHIKLWWHTSITVQSYTPSITFKVIWECTRVRYPSNKAKLEKAVSLNEPHNRSIFGWWLHTLHICVVHMFGQDAAFYTSTAHRTWWRRDKSLKNNMASCSLLSTWVTGVNAHLDHFESLLMELKYAVAACCDPSLLCRFFSASYL